MLQQIFVSILCLFFHYILKYVFKNKIELAAIFSHLDEAVGLQGRIYDYIAGV